MAEWFVFILSLTQVADYRFLSSLPTRMNNLGLLRLQEIRENVDGQRENNRRVLFRRNRVQGLGIKTKSYKSVYATKALWLVNHEMKNPPEGIAVAEQRENLQ